jgi:broad specificity phosphatase PhoE
MQAKKLGLRLKKEKIDKIYVSDLQRTVQTANEIIKYHPNVPVIYDSKLRERNYGVFEGKRGASLRRAVRKSGKSFIKYEPKNGESVLVMEARAKKFMREIIKKDNKKTILLVTHGGFIVNSFISLYNDSHDNFAKYIHKNAALSVIEISGKKVKLHQFNSTEHL